MSMMRFSGEIRCRLELSTIAHRLKSTASTYPNSYANRVMKLCA